MHITCAVKKKGTNFFAGSCVAQFFFVLGSHPIILGDGFLFLSQKRVYRKLGISDGLHPLQRSHQHLTTTYLRESKVKAWG